MRRITRLVATLGVSMIAIVGLGACGGTSVSKDIVHVAGLSISKATLDHWMPIESIIALEQVPKRPVPAGEVPDPPRYTACSAYLRATTPNGSTLSAARLKTECRRRYERVRKHMLQILITYDWLTAEATALGVRVSESEVKRQLSRYEHEQFASETAFRSFLTYTHERLADELFIEKMDLLSTKLEQRTLHLHGLTGLIKQRRAFPKEWAARTSCATGYIISSCKQYRGPEPPEAAI